MISRARRSWERDGFLLWLLYLPRRVKNALGNAAFKLCYGVSVRLDWTDLKLINIKRISLGRQFCAGRGLWLEAIGSNASISIGDNVNVSDWVHIAATNSVIIGAGALLGSKVLVSDHSHGVPYAMSVEEIDVPPNDRELFSKGPTVIEERAWLGDGVVVLSGVKIGVGAIVGANSVVSKDIPPRTVWAGAPARQIWPRQ